MATRFFLCLFLALLIAFPADARAQDQGGGRVVYMTTLEWPPYSGSDLPGQGACVMIARKAFEAVGYELRVVFLPWKRAVMTARTDPKFAGYFPEYFAERVETDFYFSERMGESPLGFIELKSDPIRWETLDDIRKYTVGVVSGYVNEKRFDDMVLRGQVRVDPVVDDKTNLKKLLGGRIDTAVMDPLVLRYLIKSERDLWGQGGLVQLNPRLLDTKGLYLCFRKTRYGKRIRDLFNKGLAKLDWQKEQERYMDWVFSSTAAP
ncbi:substrate-binding periplasmic protein [Salidesulfovibrio onnuriiensis]|uniref:substrate-binding periplasmic protein n=1 Tax=Salidesulfovibrio onnuriiensis TaxID=2583823 RepID=UPI0011C96C1F|nr:transporter substrate-binding domain-containing protein [Salidesulfovibrio onnuriiensis]